MAGSTVCTEAKGRECTKVVFVQTDFLYISYRLLYIASSV